MSGENALSIKHKEESNVDWKINNFLSLSKEVGYKIESPPFYLSHLKWVLEVFPNGETSSNSEGWIGVNLIKTFVEECSVAFTIGIKRHNGSVVMTTKEIKENCEVGTKHWCSTRLLTRSALEGSKSILDLNGSLTVFCNIRIENAKEVECQMTSRSHDVPDLVKDLNRVYLNGQYTDIRIKVKDKELTAHKCILAGRSKVFAVMFKYDMYMKEIYNGTLKIDDTDPNSFEDFIIYLYTGNLKAVSTTNALSLYKYADEYDVAELKEECVRIMTRDLSVESFCDVMHLATLHKESDLLTAAMAYFINNMKAILLTARWQAFLAENPTQCNELFFKAIDKLNKG